MSTRRVSAIIVTRNSWPDVAACLASLGRSIQPIRETIVVDHDSSDGTPDFVRREFREAIVLDFLDNAGFGEGNNRGARASSGDYLLLLNPDATLSPDALGHMLDAIEADAAIGIVVPKVVLASEPSIINSAGLSINAIGYGWDRGYLERDAGQYDRSEPVLAGSGCALLIRADVYRALHGFDPRYFLYYEDVDLCWRAWIAGHRVHYVPAAIVRHAMNVSNRPSFYNDYLDHRNRLLTLLKNASPRFLASIAPNVARFEVSNVIDLARRRQWRAVRRRTQAWNWNLGRIVGTLRRRNRVQRERRIGDAELRGLLAPGRSAPRLKAALPGYRESYEAQLDPERLSETLIMGSNDVGMLGLGWYGVETFHGTPSRWCCGYGIAFLRAPGKHAGILRVTCSAARPTDLAVAVNGREGGRYRVMPGRWHDVEVRAAFDRPIARVELFVDSAFVPSALNPRSGDHRTLGVRVARIGIADS
jgi:GT2 family glycosyltransferase